MNTSRSPSLPRWIPVAVVLFAAACSPAVALMPADYPVQLVEYNSISREVVVELMQRFKVDERVAVSRIGRFRGERTTSLVQAEPKQLESFLKALPLKQVSRSVAVPNLVFRHHYQFRFKTGEWVLKLRADYGPGMPNHEQLYYGIKKLQRLASGYVETPFGDVVQTEEGKSGTFKLIGGPCWFDENEERWNGEPVAMDACHAEVFLPGEETPSFVFDIKKY